MHMVLLWLYDYCFLIYMNLLPILSIVISQANFMSAPVSVNYDDKCGHRSRSTLVREMACCLTVPSHYMNQCCFIIKDVLFSFTWEQVHKKRSWIYIVGNVWRLHCHIFPGTYADTKLITKVRYGCTFWVCLCITFLNWTMAANTSKIAWHIYNNLRTWKMCLIPVLSKIVKFYTPLKDIFFVLLSCIKISLFKGTLTIEI